MKNKPKIWIIVVIAALAIVALLYFSSNSATIKIGNGAGQSGFDLHLYDSSGNEIAIPSGFEASSSQQGAFSMWSTETPIACTTDANCPVGTKCWTSMCVIKNVASMSLGFSVESTSSDVTYTGLNVQSSTPSQWNTALNKTARNLAPLATTVFTSSVFAIPSTWENTIVPFSVTVTGTNSYNGAVETQTKSISYKFYPNPTGGFQVTISNPFA